MPPGPRERQFPGNVGGSLPALPSPTSSPPSAGPWLAGRQDGDEVMDADMIHLLVTMAVTFVLVFAGVAGTLSLVMRWERARERRRLAEALVGASTKG